MRGYYKTLLRSSGNGHGSMKFVCKAAVSMHYFADNVVEGLLYLYGMDKESIEFVVQ